MRKPSAINLQEAKPVSVKVACLALAFASLTACSTMSPATSRDDPAANRDTRNMQTRAQCVLPGQVRKSSSKLTLLTPSQVISASVNECKRRGGEVVSRKFKLK